jgi:vacuolar-type H+-ATPase subunit I/STV1
MFMYRAAAWLVNTHAPEISMGLNTAEEIRDTFDATADDEGTFAVPETVKDRIAVVEAVQHEEEVIEVHAVVETKGDEPDPHADWKASIDEIATIEDFIAHLNKMPAKVKKELHTYLEAKQASIRAKTAAPAQNASSID